MISNTGSQWIPIVAIVPSMKIGDNFLWVEKYRPRNIKDTILPKEMKATFQSFVDQKNIPNLLLAGPSGVGKTTIAKALLETLGCDYIIINGSMKGNIDTLRNEIQNFASTISMRGGRKYVILDEADYLTGATQAALRNFMEEYSKNCGFILTCNLKNRIVEPIHSRCSVIDFKIPKKELPALAGQFMDRLCGILDQENIKYDKKVLVQIITKHHPDWRRILNEVQRYSPAGIIDTGILVNLDEASFGKLVDILKNKDFTNMRKWVAENTDQDPNTLYRKIYDTASQYIHKESIPSVVLILGKYQYQHSFCADHEINLACCLTEIMADAEWS